MKELYNALLPDDRPITAVAVIEDTSKCPGGYSVVAKSYDQDVDADLWKDGFSFGKRITRYLCLSKTEGPSGFVVDSLCIINDKDSPPNGYILLSKTYGSEQKAWRKRQLCYRLSEKSSVFLAITDVIILSRSKKAPEGFTMAGEVNGLLVCYKSAPLPPDAPKPLSNLVLPPFQNNQRPKSPIPDSNTSLTVPSNTSNPTSPVKLPLRPAPLPPPSTVTPSHGPDSTHRNIIVATGTLSGFSGLEGVPFTLGPGIKQAANSDRPCTARGLYKTAEQLNTEYKYSFATEREAMFRL